MASANQNMISDEDPMDANIQRGSRNTTTAQATDMSDVSFDSNYSTFQGLDADSSITQGMDSGNVFDGWSKGELLKLLTKACPDIFDISIWWNEEEVLIKEFARQHLMDVKSVAELRLSIINMKKEHEIYQSRAKRLQLLCVQMNKLSKDWWKEAEKRNRQKTDEINEDEKRYREHIKPNLVQKECCLSVIGDTSAGKTSMINLLCEEPLLPTGPIKTTSGICELCYSTTKCLSRKSKNSLVSENIPLDFSLPSTTLSSALERFVANQTAQRQEYSSSLYKLEWPIELLQSGVNIYDTPGFNDCPELTDIIIEHMKKSLVFLIVINCGITDSLQKSLDQLKKLQATGKTLFCVVTHIEDKTVDEQKKSLNGVKTQILKLFPEFNPDHCVMLDPKKALSILKTYQVYEINHFKFLQVFIPFLSQIFTLKIAEQTNQIRSMMERFNQFVQICYNFCDEEFRKNYATKSEIEDQKLNFKDAKKRLKVKIDRITEDLNVKAVLGIVTKFLDADFKRQFMETAESTVFPENIMAAVNWNAEERKLSRPSEGEEYGFASFMGRTDPKLKLIDEYELSFLSAARVSQNSNYATAITTTDAFKVYLQVRLVKWVEEQMIISLSQIAERVMIIIYQTCSEDLKIVNNAIQRRYQFLARRTVHDLNTKRKYSLILTPMLTNHKKIFSGDFKVKLGAPRMFLMGMSVSIWDIVIVGEQIYEVFKGYTVEEIRRDPTQFNREVAERVYQRISDKMNDQDEQKKLQKKLGEDYSLFFGDTLSQVERALIDIEQLAQLQQVCENNEEWQKICGHYLKQIILLLSDIHNFQARNLLQWSLKANQVNVDKQSAVLRSIFDGSIMKYGTLKKQESDEPPQPVSIRSLHHEFDILRVCEEININRLITHDNLLYCYGAYLSENIVHIVTETYTRTLEDFLCSNEQLRARDILQISLQLTEAVDFVLQKIENEEMYNSFVLNTNSVMVTADLKIKLNVVANKVDFLYQPPEELFPRYVEFNSDKDISKLFSSIYSLGLIYYRLCHRKPKEISYFKSGKWLLPPQEEQQGAVETVEVDYYINFVATSYENSHFQFRTPTIDHDSNNISTVMYDLIGCCCSINFTERPALNVPLSILRCLLFMQDSDIVGGIEPPRIPKTTFSSIPVKYGLLAIDGGGTRGIIPATIIEFLERKSGKNFWKLFDFAAGCSTGGILVLASMLRRAKGTDLVTLYRSFAEKVFPYQRYLPTSQYSPVALEELLQTEFGDTTMTPQPQDPLTFVVTKRDTETKPFLIRNYDNPSSRHQGDVGWKCFEAARATTAAPTYFKPFQKNNHNYTDGGVGFNNPVELLYDEAFAHLSSDLNKNSSAAGECPIAYIVSIGTGKMPDLPLTNPNTLPPFRLINDISSIVEQASDSENAHHRMENICQQLKIPYYRFNPNLQQRADLTETIPLNEWCAQTKHYMNSNAEQVNQLCALFSQKTCSMPCTPYIGQKKK